MPLGRRDARTASIAAANASLPPVSDGLTNLVARFAAKGLSLRDLTALCGAHTVGAARCANFRPHVYNDSNVDPGFATLRRGHARPRAATTLWLGWTPRVPPGST